MKYIIKGHPPHAVIKWHKDDKDKEVVGPYEGLRFPKKEALLALIREQRGLCAYTQIRLIPEDSHIEHFKPQSVCISEDLERQKKNQSLLQEDVDWRNMLACYPSGQKNPGFGAVQKGSEVGIISPLRPDCEARISFDKGMRVIENANDSELIETLKTIKLNDAALVERRKKAAKGAGFDKTAAKAASKAETLAFLNGGWQEFVEAGQYREFCTALRDAASHWLRFLERVEKRKV